MEDSPKSAIYEGSRSVPSGISMRPGILKLIHQFLLQTYPVKDVWQFWNHNLTDSGNNSRDSRVSINAILYSDKFVRVDYVMKVLAAFELFLTNQGKGSNDFARKIYSTQANIGFTNFGKAFRTWVLPLMEKNSQKVDIRDKILDLNDTTWKLICRNFYFETVKKTKKGNTFNVVFLFALKTRHDLISPPFNCEQWIGERVKTLPLMFGLPEYEQFQIISDVRNIDEIIPGASIITENDFLPIRAVKGKKYSFREFISHRGITIPHLDARSLRAEVVEVLDDYYCPTRKRIVLHKRCIYGAPVYLFQVVYTESKLLSPWESVPHTLKIMEREKRLENRLKVKHEEFLKQGDSKCAFLYSKQSDSMFLNRKYLTRNVPAKIFRKIILQYLQDGTTEFQRRWLLDDAEIVQDRANPNLERRFELLVAALKRKCPGCCCFTRPSKGIIAFVPKGKITLDDR